jgi:hypothetical protein
MFALPLPDYASLASFKGAEAYVDNAARVEALTTVWQHVFARYREILAWPARNFSPIPSAGPLLARVQEDGFSFTTSNKGGKAALIAASRHLFDELQASLDKNPKPYIKSMQAHLNRSDHRAVYEAAEAAIADTGVMDAAEAYQGVKLQLGNLALQINEDRITTFHQGYVDQSGVPEHRTSYFHIDSACWPHLRVMLYLTPVGIEQGPFRYVPGTHRLANDFELAVRKANHKVNLPPHLFLALPDALRAKSDFGNDLDDESAESNALLAREVACFGGDKDLVLFDYNGIHRGGFVRKGRRYVVTFGFKAA